MSNSPEAEIKVQVLSLNPVYKPQADLEVSFEHTCDCRHHDHSMQREPEIDPDKITFGFRIVEEKMLIHENGSMIIKREDAKKLNLMVGDFITIKLTKTAQ